MPDSPPIRHVLFDLDGTLIGRSGELHDTVWAGLERLRDAEIAATVCTGRPWGGVAERVARRLDPEGWHVTHGGALIRRVDGKILAAHELPAAAIEAMVATARTVGLTLELYTPDALYVDARTAWSERHAELLDVESLTHDLLEIARTHTIIKTQWIVGEQDARALRERGAPGCHMAQARSDVMPEVTFITVTRQGVDKGSAARALANQLRLSLSEMSAVGDSAGDVPMLDVVGRPFIMGGAPDELTARYHPLGHVDDDGVLEAIDILIAQA